MVREIYLDMNASSTRLGSPRLLKMLLWTLLHKDKRLDMHKQNNKVKNKTDKQDKAMHVTHQPLLLILVIPNDSANICYCLTRSSPCTRTMIHMDCVSDPIATCRLRCLRVLSAWHATLKMPRKLISDQTRQNTAATCTLTAPTMQETQVTMHTKTFPIFSARHSPRCWRERRRNQGYPPHPKKKKEQNEARRNDTPHRTHHFSSFFLSMFSAHHITPQGFTPVFYTRDAFAFKLHTPKIGPMSYGEHSKHHILPPHKLSQPSFIYRLSTALCLHLHLCLPHRIHPTTRISTHYFLLNYLVAHSLPTRPTPTFGQHSPRMHFLQGTPKHVFFIFFGVVFQ